MEEEIAVFKCHRCFREWDEYESNRKFRLRKCSVCHNDKPAVIDRNRQVWYKYGELHREGDLPAVIDGDRREWYNYGELHRKADMPAVISGDYQVWYKNGERY